MDDYISKPIAGPLLIETIEKWLMAKETNNNQIAKECSMTKNEFQLVNLSTLEQLRQMGLETNSNLMEEIIDIFFIEGVEKIGLMKRKFENKDYVEVGKLAHHFKSSCNGVGAESLSQNCAQLEQSCKLGNPDQISGLIHQIELTYPKTVTILNSIKGTPKVA
jgi:HPt (histidine-containing phosphotransfer) domain-containing protein